VNRRGYSATVVELTPRMRDVLACAAAGLSIDATALELGIASTTVVSLRAAACSRLGAANVVQAVALAVRSGAL